MDRLEAFRDNEKSPLEGELRYRLSDRIDRDGELGSMRIDGSLVIDGTQAMTVSGDVVFMSREDYTALRRFQRARKPLGTAAGVAVKPVDAALVGRRDPRNVVLGEGNLLVIDRRHPSFFDHGYDHVPGPLMVEFSTSSPGLAPSPSRVAAPEAPVTVSESPVVPRSPL